LKLSHLPVSLTSGRYRMDQFIEPSYLPQARRVATMGRRYIEIKPIKDDRNRSVYVSPGNSRRLWTNLLFAVHFSKEKVAYSRKHMSYLCFATLTSRLLSSATTKSSMSILAVISMRFLPDINMYVSVSSMLDIY
jgi:hypothetical protein